MVFKTSRLEIYIFCYIINKCNYININYLLYYIIFFSHRHYSFIFPFMKGESLCLAHF